MRRNVLLIVVLLAVNANIFAETPTAVRLKVDAAELLPGTHYEIALQAEYGVVDPTVPLEKNDLKHFIASSDQVKLDFVAKGHAYSHDDFILNLPKNLPVAPPEFMSGLFFTIKVKITPPARSGLPVVVREKVYVTPSGNGVVTRCFRLRGPSLGAFFYIGVADCKQPIRTPPPGRDRKSQ
jgi:hypothetical protein